jgi:antirestriction protein ArdC
MDQAVPPLRSSSARDDHAIYLGHWLEVLKEDKRAIFSAAAHAQRAADFLHGLQPGDQEEPEDGEMIDAPPEDAIAA